MMSVAVRPRLLLAAILLVGLALRFWGITWGAPERRDLHPDETDHVMNHALSLSFHDLDPKFLSYPSLTLYAVAAANGVGTRLGWITAEWQSYVVGRSVVAVFGTLTIGLAAMLAAELGADALGILLAALWVALLPLHVWESHVAVTDVVMSFWVLATLVFSLRLLRRTKDVDVSLGGTCLGLAAASKYTAVLGVAALAGAILLSRRSLREKCHALFVSSGCAVVAFALATPFTLIHLGDFLAAVSFEMRHVHGHQAGFSVPAAGPQYHRYLYQLVAAFPFSYGIALHAAVVAGGAWAVTRFDRRFGVVILFAALFFGVTGSWTFTPLRYYLPVVVLGAIFAGCWQADWMKSGSSSRRVVALASIVVAFVYTSIFTVQTTARFSHDTRIEAAHWIRETLRPGERLLLAGWRPYMAMPEMAPGTIVSRKETVVLGNLPSYSNFSLVEISSLHYLRWYRHGHPGLVSAYQHLRNEEGPMRLVTRFEADFLNRDLYRALDPMFESYFLSPTLELYAPVGSRLDPGRSMPPS